MRRRLGDHPIPSAVLTGKHMRWINDHYNRMFQHAPTRFDRAQASHAGVAHLSSYLGWLRGMETFGQQWRDIQVTPPDDGPTLGLPPGFGVVQTGLLEQTKSSQYFKADVVIAYHTASGLCLGLWIERLREHLPASALTPASFVIAHPSGACWTSHYYRHKFLYPALVSCRASGDPFLSKINNTPGNTIPERFWKFNTQRRSGPSEASKKRPWTIRAATNTEVVEHGRWRISRSSLDMPLAYLEWSIEDRSCITAFCM
jgi:hypothetical protein